MYQPRRDGQDFYQHPTNGCFLAALSLGDPVVVFDTPAESAAWNRRSSSLILEREEAGGETADSSHLAVPTNGPESRGEAANTGDKQ